MQVFVDLRCEVQGTLELQNPDWSPSPGQLFPFWHLLILCLIPPWQVLLQADQLPQAPQVAAAQWGKETSGVRYIQWSKVYEYSG